MIEHIERQGGVVESQIRTKYFSASIYNAFGEGEELKTADTVGKAGTTMLEQEVTNDEL